ncbi:MAG: amino acid adenylation domain-containing protein, partial [Acutalibacteraceae bacterium]|nr:amino acid adenylation domain-containing protein [Acutalibacteraceae bacterium]
EELIALYNGEKLEPLTHQFKDYSEWMRTRDLSSQKEYWVNEFSDEIPVLDMPLDYARPQMQSYNGATVCNLIDDETSEKINTLSRKTGTTPYMIFLSALMIMLSKYSRQEDIVVGSPISGRTHKDTEKMLGMFVNTLAMRGRPEGNKKYSDFLAEIKASCLKAYENQEYPFEELVENVDVNRDMSRNPLFDIMFAMQNNEQSKGEVSDVDVSNTATESSVSKFELEFNVSEFNGKFVVGLVYCADLYKCETAVRILNNFAELMKNIVSSYDAKLCEIDMITDDDRDSILNEFNNTYSEYPRDKTVAELFEEQVEKTPDKIAVKFENEQLTYKELNEKANALAYKLIESGVKADDFVAILAERCIETVVSVCGILKAGGAYVPIDPTYPESRIKFIIEDCSPKVIINCVENELSFNTDIPVIKYTDNCIFGSQSNNPDNICTSESLIYCIYTSGTTGNPKGSMIENRSVIRLVKNNNYVELNSESVILQTGSVSFDASTFEIWGALLNGGTLILASQEAITDRKQMKNILAIHKVNTLFLTTTLFNQMISEDKTMFNSLKYLLTGGEKVSYDHVRMFKNNNKNTVLIHCYGPTENTTFTTTCEIPEEYEIISIGKSISNTKVYILNNMQLCGIGVPGELCIAGDGVARGYLNRPELTAEKFIDNPFGEGKLYRSGDLVRWLSDGSIDFLGRIDDQVKIRGFRIELGEIESKIREISGIKDSAVIVKADKGGDKAIYAYYTGDTEISITYIRDILSESLPAYMIPSYMMQIDEIPVTTNGKLNKRALPEIDAKTTKEYIAPRTETEKVICEVFVEILGAEKVGINDGFFELGGHSLRATRLVNS